MNERDQTRLRELLNEAYKARKFLQGKTQSNLEAASKVTKETRELYPQIAWRNIIGMRNRMIHEYNDVDLDIVWEVVHRNLPNLIIELEFILPPE